MSTANKTDQATQIIKGEKKKNSNFTQRNTLASLLNRAIKFRKSRYVDRKLEAFKQKFAPVNGVTGIVHAASASAYGNDKGGEDNLADIVDANGFERPSKTLFNRKKLNAVWNEIHPVGSGLKDLGNLSALNAILQAFTYTPALANYLLDRIHGSNCTIQEYCFVCALEEHVRTVLKGSPYAIQPRLFAGKIRKMPRGSSKDAFAIYQFFLEQIQEFLLSEKTSKDKRIRETTALYHMFGGYLQRKLSCPACSQEENTYDSFLDISLNLNNGKSVERCITEYFKQPVSVLDRECIHCQHEGAFKGKQSIYKPPMNLVIQLQRFITNDAEVTKNNKFINFEETLDISRAVTETEKQTVNSKYHLYAVIVHTGETFHGGHYVAYVKSSNGIWYCMDNENVQVVSLKRLLEEKAYLLFYQIPPEPENKQPKPQPKKQNISKPVEMVKTTISKDDSSESEEEVVSTNSVTIEKNEKNVIPLMSEENTEEEEEEEEETKQLRQAMEAASNKQKVENSQAVVVDQRESTKIKREKLNALIEKESEVSKSAEVKEALLAKASNIQFQDNVDTWGEDIGSTVEKRDKVLKQMKSKRKKVDTYDLEYDRGKVKKVKKKREEKFNQPNLFQAAADMKLQQKSKQKHKGK